MIKISGFKSNWFRYHKKLIKKYLWDTYSVESSFEYLARKKCDYRFSDTTYQIEKVFIFENTDNGLIFLLDPHDRSHHGLHMLDILNNEPNVVHVLKSQFNPEEYSIQDNFTPSGYFPREFEKYINIIDEVIEHRNISTKRDGLFFTGKLWKRRRRIVNHMQSIISSSERLPFIDFVKRMSEYRIVLSLPGKGNLCHREFEAMGIGVPVLMPRLKNILPDLLIPNVHYIAVDQPEQIRDTYMMVRDNQSLLNDISRNAMEWFDRNCRYPNCYKPFDVAIKKIIDIR